jgi:hypothetical protein
MTARPRTKTGHATTAELGGLNYAGEVTCCRPCAEGKKRASRFINKVPKSQRSNREAKVRGRAAAFCNSVLLCCTCSAVPALLYLLCCTCSAVPALLYLLRCTCSAAALGDGGC